MGGVGERRRQHRGGDSCVGLGVGVRVIVGVGVQVLAAVWERVRRV